MISIFFIGLIIGIPTMIIGCNDYSCPSYHRIMANTTDSRFLDTKCPKIECSYSSSTGYNNCTDANYDCSHWVTTVSYSLVQKHGECELESGPHVPGTNIQIYVKKADSTCCIDLDKTITVLPIVGTVFLSISGLAFLVCCFKQDSPDDYDWSFQSLHFIYNFLIFFSSFFFTIISHLISCVSIIHPKAHINRSCSRVLFLSQFIDISQIIRINTIWSSGSIEKIEITVPWISHSFWYLIHRFTSNRCWP